MSFQSIRKTDYEYWPIEWEDFDLNPITSYDESDQIDENNQTTERFEEVY